MLYWFNIPKCSWWDWRERKATATARSRLSGPCLSYTNPTRGRELQQVFELLIIYNNWAHNDVTWSGLIVLSYVGTYKKKWGGWTPLYVPRHMQQMSPNTYLQQLSNGWPLHIQSSKRYIYVYNIFRISSKNWKKTINGHWRPSSPLQ